jgi:hypothetical protein
LKKFKNLKIAKISITKNSETGRRKTRKGRRRIFVIPRPIFSLDREKILARPNGMYADNV